MDIRDFKIADGRRVMEFQDDRSTGGIPMLKFPLLEMAGIAEHGFTTREGGVSQGIYSSLNFSYTRGDEKAAVDENFHRAAVSFHAGISDFVLTDQTHTANVRTVTRADCGKGITRNRDYSDTDGLVTNEPGIVLAAFFADCVPLFFADPVQRAVGVSHSGWRGTAAHMGRQTVRAMEQAYGSRPEDIICAIGPSICQECYEVSKDVAERFMEEFPHAGPQLCYPSAPGKFQLNLWKANELVLLEAGILAGHLAVTNICTCCNPGLLFSHRATNGKRGNLGAFIKLKNLEG